MSLPAHEEIFRLLVRYVDIGIQEVVIMLLTLKYVFCNGVSFREFMDIVITSS